MKTSRKLAAIGLATLVSASVPSSFADEPSNLNEWIGNGSLVLNERLRYEFVDQDGLDKGNALTLRSRIGWQTASMNGLTAAVDFENVVAADTGAYGLPGLTRGKGVVADNEVTEFNQYFLDYKSDAFSAKFGRQRWILDNARFVGNVGWRQNEQTFDAAVFGFKPSGTSNIQLGYIDNVNRILGNDGTNPGLTNLESDSILVNGAFDIAPEFKLSTFAYLLDFENAAALSSDTYGFRATGAIPSSDDFKLSYAASYALQGDNSGSIAGSDFEADYYSAELTGKFKGGSLTLGYEVLGSDNGVSFKTPLATLHAFNGWADKFLGTPGSGLEDLYLSYNTKIGEFPVALVYHDFSSDINGIDYGSEIDGLVKYAFGNGVVSIFKISYYDADNFATDTTRFSLQFDYAFTKK